MTMVSRLELMRRTSGALCCGTIAFLFALTNDALTEVTKANFDKCKAQVERNFREQSVWDNGVRNAIAAADRNSKIASLTKAQPEFQKSVGNYLRERISKDKIKQIAAKSKELRNKLRFLERNSGVPREVILAIWSLETDLSRNQGTVNTITALTTLYCLGYRGEFFKREMFALIELMKGRVLTAKSAIGSWAGAMGPMQFMPSSVLRYGQDGDNDGKVQVHNLLDSWASAANLLKVSGWASNVHWGFEVTIPSRFGYETLTDVGRSWIDRGVRPVAGLSLLPQTRYTLYFPAGHEGPAFLVSDNFEVFRSYNDSDAYALAVGLLSDAIAQNATNNLSWPEIKPLSKQQRTALKFAMNALGADVTVGEGRIDLHTRNEIHLLQKKFGMVPDGHPTAAFLAVVLAKANMAQ